VERGGGREEGGEGESMERERERGEGREACMWHELSEPL
jgi:hypothetical protein